MHYSRWCRKWEIGQGKEHASLEKCMFLLRICNILGRSNLASLMTPQSLDSFLPPTRLGDRDLAFRRDPQGESDDSLNVQGRYR